MILLHTERRLTDLDSKTHLSHKFTVPEGTTRLRIDYSFGPFEIEGHPGSNNCGLSLFDPNGFRGAGHSRRMNDVNLSRVSATPGYIPGELPAGEWDAVIDVHLVVPGGYVDYSLHIEAFSEALEGAAPNWENPALSSKGPGWFRGDLHAHTVHSDGRWDVPDLIEAARKRGLDFQFLTDHNTVSPLPEHFSRATDDLHTFGGQELTTFYGHALALGIHSWIDWRVKEGERTITQIREEVEAAGGTFIVAHPMSVGDPICTGCDWQYSEMMPGTALLVEIWNGGVWLTDDEYNPKALALWYEWLNAGHRIIATAGTDVHGTELDSFERIGYNVVYAEDLTEQAILAAIRQGHSYLSAGPTLTFTARTHSGITGMCGDLLPDEDTEYQLTWTDDVPQDAQLRVIQNGAVTESHSIEPSGQRTWARNGNTTRWCVAEIRSRDGEILAITNPIFSEL